MAIEVDETEYRTLQAGMALLKNLQNNPQTRPLFGKAVKVIHPEVQTPEDVAEDIGGKMLEPVRGEITKISERLEAMAKRDEARETKLAEQQAQAAMTAAFDRLRAEGLRPEGEEEVKKIMVERSIADPEAAWALFQRKNPAPAEVATSSWEPNHWNLRTQAVDYDVEGLFKDPDRWADQAVGRILMEERSARAA